MTRTGCDEIRVDALGAIIPYVGGFKCEAFHESLAMLAGCGDEVLRRLSLALLIGTLCQPFPPLFGVGLTLDSCEREDPLPVVRVAGMGDTGEPAIRENDEMVPGPVASRLGASGTPGGDLAGGVVPHFLEQGEVEGW